MALYREFALPHIDEYILTGFKMQFLSRDRILYLVFAILVCSIEGYWDMSHCGLELIWGCAFNTLSCKGRQFSTSLKKKIVRHWHPSILSALHWLSSLQASNIDDVLCHHTSFLDNCLKDCMLTNPELLKIFSKLMSVCVMFTNCMQVSYILRLRKNTSGRQ